MLNKIYYFHCKSTFFTRNITKGLHKSVKNKEKNAKLHKSVVGYICIRSIFALKKEKKALWKYIHLKSATYRV